jgi:hypothetical protein
MSSKNKAKLLYEEACNLYLHLFCEKHGFNAEYPDTCWIANNIGGVAFIGDYLVDMETMRYDIDNDLAEPNERYVVKLSVSAPNPHFPQNAEYFRYGNFKEGLYQLLESLIFRV